MYKLIFPYIPFYKRMRCLECNSKDIFLHQQISNSSAYIYTGLFINRKGKIKYKFLKLIDGIYIGHVKRDKLCSTIFCEVKECGYVSNVDENLVTNICPRIKNYITPL